MQQHTVLTVKMQHVCFENKTLFVLDFTEIHRITKYPLVLPLFHGLEYPFLDLSRKRLFTVDFRFFHFADFLRAQSATEHNKGKAKTQKV